MASAVTQPQEVRAQLERILASTPFAGSHRGQRFLRYVVDNSLDVRTSRCAIRALSCTAHLRLLGDREHMRHAEEDLHRMLEFDPHSTPLINELSCVSYYEGRYKDSIHYYRAPIASDPKAAITYWGLGRSLTREGHYDEALEVLKRFK